MRGGGGANLGLGQSDRALKQHILGSWVSRHKNALYFFIFKRPFGRRTILIITRLLCNTPSRFTPVAERMLSIFNKGYFPSTIYTTTSTHDSLQKQALGKRKILSSLQKR